MKKIIVFLLIGLILQGRIFGQENKDYNKWSTFFKVEDSLMIAAYYEKNTANYQEHLEKFEHGFKSIKKNQRVSFQPYQINAYYNFACLYSILNDKANALLQLKKSIHAGYIDYAHIMQDPDLDNIRQENGFQQLIQPLKAIGDYHYILSNGNIFDYNQTQKFPSFTYQSKNDSNLIKLRTTFNLDSIAGNGSDVDKTINLMHWLHNLVKHDGNSALPSEKNALALIKICSVDERGINCRGLAITLNECLLCMGYKSRYVTCLPKDSLKIDQDCHVINSVYIPSLKKWIWLDPTFDTYVKDENGQYLSILEVREKIINNKPLFISENANWNNTTPQTVEYYLRQYMAKNLYMLECPIYSKYDLETYATTKQLSFVRLIPVNHLEQIVIPVKQTANNGNTIIRYGTNNPALFLKQP